MYVVYCACIHDSSHVCSLTSYQLSDAYVKLTCILPLPHVVTVLYVESISIDCSQWHALQKKNYILSGKMIVPFLLLRTWLQTVPSGDVSGIHGSHYNTYLISIIYCFLYSICFFLLSFKSRVRFGMTGKSLWDIFSQSHFMSLSSVAYWCHLMGRISAYPFEIQR